MAPAPTLYPENHQVFSVLTTPQSPLILDFCLRKSHDEGGEYVFGSMDLASKSAQIVDFCGKSIGFTEFENTEDQLRIFARIPDCSCLFGS